MKEYHKIQTVYLRDPETKFKTLLVGQYALPEFEYLAYSRWVFTEKVDGTNIRVMWDGSRVSFGGKTDNATLPANLAKYLPATFTTEIMARQFGAEGGVCLYGEGFGAGIQKGGVYGKNQEFCLFDVRVGEWWLRRDAVEEIAEKMGIQFAPTIGTGTLPEMVERARAGFNSMWGNFVAEGIVARPEVELLNRGGQRVITKIKHKDFKEKQT